MEITDVKVKLVENRSDKLLAFCTLTIDQDFVIRDLKIIDGPKGAFVAMPSRKLTDRCPRCGGKNHRLAKFCNACGGKIGDGRNRRGDGARTRLHADIAHPITSECREFVQSKVLDAFEAERERSKEEGYVAPDLDADFVDEPEYDTHPDARLERRPDRRPERQPERQPERRPEPRPERSPDGPAAREDRPERSDRPERTDRPDRPDRRDRPERRERPAAEVRPAAEERPERRPAARGDRPGEGREVASERPEGRDDAVDGGRKPAWSPPAPRRDSPRRPARDLPRPRPGEESEDNFSSGIFK